MIGTKAPESGGHSRHPYTPSAFNKHLKRGFSSATYGRESGGEVRREAGSEGYAEKYRAVVNGGYSKDEPVGQRWGKVEPALWRRRRSHPPTATRCVRSARYGRSERDPRRTLRILGWH